MKTLSVSKEKFYSAPALTRGLRILELLAVAGRPLSQTEISQALGKSPGEQFRMLAVLVQEGYISRDSNGAYRPTLKMYALGKIVNPWETLLAAAAAPMREFSAATGRECHLSILEEGMLVVLTHESGTAAVSIQVRAGSRHNPLQTASGRLLLSHLPAGEANRHAALASTKFGDCRRLTKSWHHQLAVLSKQGYALAHDESLPGLQDVAVPVLHAADGQAAALASSHFVQRRSKKAVPAALHDLQIASQKISSAVTG